MRAMTTRLVAGSVRRAPVLAALLAMGISMPLAAAGWPGAGWSEAPAPAQAPATQPPPAQTAPSQTAPAAAPAPADSGTAVRLEVRVFDGTEDVTAESRVKLYPKGQRSSDIPMAAGSAGQPSMATVPVGFYDAQAIREKRGEPPSIRWAEQWLVQRYPDEYGRHLEVINYRPGYGALQIRPAPTEAASAKGWSGIAYPAGDPTKEVSKASPAGEDLLFALPSGRYDIKLTLADKSVQWIRDIDVPADRTRLKTWSAGSSSR